MKNVINLIKTSNVENIIISKKSSNKITWHFSNKTNRLISNTARLEISTGKFQWPSLCVIKENGIAKIAIGSKKISFFQKMKLASILRQFKKELKAENDIANHKNDEPDYGYISINDDELEYIEYEQQSYGS